MRTSIWNISAWKKSHQRLLIYVFLTLAPLIVFLQVKHFEFVKFDDTMYVLYNSHVQSGLNPDSVKWSFTTLEFESWQPLVWLSFMANYEIFGMNAGGYHLTNLVLHILSTLLLFWGMNRMTGFQWRSAFVALFFSINPVHVESVAWIAERKDTLSGFFFCLTLCMYALYAEKRTLKAYGLLVLSFCLGLMSKPMLVTLPVIFILLDYWPLGRFSSPSETAHGQEHRPSLFPTKAHVFKIPLWQVAEKLPFFLISLALGLTALKAQGAQNIVSGTALHPLDIRIFNAFVSYATYILNIFAPYNLCAFYPFNENLPMIQIIFCIVLFVLICVMALMSIRRYPFVFVGWSWFVIMLLPVIGIIPLGKEALTDRYTYLSAIGLSLILAWGVPLLLKGDGLLKKLLVPVSVIYLGTLGSLAWIQCGYWENSITLFSRALAVTENNDMMHYNIAAIYIDKRDFTNAKSHLLESIRINPQNGQSYSNLGAIYMQEGDKEKALKYYNEGLKYNPMNQVLHYNLGKVYGVEGNIDKAVEHLERAISMDPEYTEAYQSIAAIFFKNNEPEKAIETLSRAVKANPGYEKGHAIMASYYASTQNPSESIKHLQAIVAINPQSLEAYYHLGVMYANTNNHFEARKHLMMALQLRPDFNPALKLLNQLPQ